LIKINKKHELELLDAIGFLKHQHSIRTTWTQWIESRSRSSNFNKRCNR